MPTITLAVPEELKREMDKSKEINWSEVAREAIRERISHLKLFRAMTAKSKLTEADARRIGEKIKRSLWKKYKTKGW